MISLAENLINRTPEATKVSDQDKFVFWQNGNARFVTVAKLMDHFNSGAHHDFLSLFLQRANRVLSKAEETAVRSFRLRGTAAGALTDCREPGWYLVPAEAEAELTDFPGAFARPCFLLNLPGEDGESLQLLCSARGTFCARSVTAEGKAGAWSPEPQTAPTAAACRRAFVAAMNEKAASIGMRDSAFVTASGWGKQNRCTALDMLKCAVFAYSYEPIRRVWSRREAVIHPGGRAVPVSNQLQFDALKGYEILGGKLGARRQEQYSGSFVCVARHIASGRVLAGVVLNAEKPRARYQAMQDLLDATAETLETGVSERGITGAECAASCVVEPGSVAVRPVVLKNENTVTMSTSITKLLAMIVACDCVSNFRAKYVVTEDDIRETSAGDFAVGDAVTVEDLMLDAMLASSHSAATALASCVGGLLLEAN